MRKTKAKRKSPAPAEVTERLGTLAADAANAEEGEGKFMDPASKRKQGRHKKDCDCPKCEARRAGGGTSPGTTGALSAEAQQAEIEKIKPLVRPMWEVISHVGVKIAETKEAAIGPNEMMILVDSSAACVNQYLPGILGEHASAIVLTMTFAQWSVRVWMLRRMQLEVLIEERKARRAQAEAEAVH